MCGIAGIISDHPERLSRANLKKMADTLAHRGPDGEGIWLEREDHVGLAHRRLAVIDLSPHAAQPLAYMHRYQIVFNGEIYNFQELRMALLKHGYSFKSHSDTEVILALYDRYGKECLPMLDGMFAFAIWDQSNKTLFCARDRFGEKPFYYHIGKDFFAFASEMKALWEIGVDRAPKETALLNYLTVGWSDHPSDPTDVFYKEIHQLAPAHWFRFQEGDESIRQISYWKIDSEATNQWQESAVIERLNALLTDAVRSRLKAEKSVGATFSGGLDSSSILAIGNQFSAESLPVFSVLFPGFDKDESDWIQRHYQTLGSKQLYTTEPIASELYDDFDQLLWHHELPLSSSSVYAQYKLYQLAAAKGCTVLLEGQGADELLAGYGQYYHWYWQELFGKGKWRQLKQELKAARSIGVKEQWNVKHLAASILPELASRRLIKKVKKQQKKQPDLNREFLRTFGDSATDYKPMIHGLNDLLAYHSGTFGLSTLLRNADRSSMAFGREVRLPFLQHELVAFIFSLKSNYKIRDGYSKWILRKATEHLLPTSICWRKDKIGFETPQAAWMQSKSLQEMLQEGKKNLVEHRILDAAVLRKPAQIKGAYEPENYDWRYLCAGLLINSK